MGSHQNVDMEVGLPVPIDFEMPALSSLEMEEQY